MASEPLLVEVCPARNAFTCRPGTSDGCWLQISTCSGLALLGRLATSAHGEGAFLLGGSPESWPHCC